jgi:hypothetical protein
MSELVIRPAKEVWEHTKVIREKMIAECVSLLGDSLRSCIKNNSSRGEFSFVWTTPSDCVSREVLQKYTSELRKQGYRVETCESDDENLMCTRVGWGVS